MFFSQIIKALLLIGVRLKSRATGRDDVIYFTTTDDSTIDVLVIPLPSDTAGLTQVRVVARNVATGEIFAKLVRRGIKNIGGTVTATDVGASSFIVWNDNSMVTCTANTIADDTNKGIAVRISGIAATTINWSIEAETTIAR